MLRERARKQALEESRGLIESRRLHGCEVRGSPLVALIAVNNGEIVTVEALDSCVSLRFRTFLSTEALASWRLRKNECRAEVSC